MTTHSLPISSVGCDPTRKPDDGNDLSTATPPIRDQIPDKND